MGRQKVIRYIVVPLTLVGVFLLGTLGGVLHHHEGSSDGSCSICYSSAQPMERPLHRPATPILAAIGPRLEILEPGPTTVAEVPRLPSRAPPSA